MTDRSDLDVFDRQVDALVVKVGDLRAAASPAARPEAARAEDAERLDVALQELEVAEEELRVAREEVLAQRVRAADPAADRERKLLRALLTDLPVPVFLLERDGIVRRANRAACMLIDVPAAYPVGKPFTVFVSLRDRGALRFAVSAAAAGTVGTPARAQLTARGTSRNTALWLAPVQVPGEAEPLVAVVALPTGAGAPPLPSLPAVLGALDGALDRALDGADGADGTDGTDGPLEGTGRGAGGGAGRGPGSAGWPARPADPGGVRRLDLMAAMTRLLLAHEHFDEPEKLRRAGELLAGELADWVLVDLVRSRDGGLARRLVVGRDPVFAEQVRAHDPGPGELPTRVAANRRPALSSRVEDPAELGRLSGGQPVGALLDATSTVCVPLLPPDRTERLLGTVTLVRSAGRPPFDLGELGLLQQLCEHLALALRAGRSVRRRTEVADALRSSLLPRRLPRPDGLRIAATIRPADPVDQDGAPSVGGDFYDAVPAGDGWAVALGEVSGKGEEAAALTATVRHAVRVLAHTEPRPDRVLSAVNGYLRAQPDTDRFVTVVLAHLIRRPDGWRATVSSAGHPPPLVLRADGRAEHVDTGGGPLALCDDARPAPTTVDLGPGDTLLLCSDGVTDARGPDGRAFGEQALVATAMAARNDPDRLVGAVRDAVVAANRDRLRDDVSLLAVRAD